MASILLEEQETVIIISRTEDTVRISTSDSTMKTKFDKLCEISPKMYKRIRENDSEVFSFYELADKSLVSFRKNKRELSEEQKIAAGERMKNWRAKIQESDQDE